MRSITQRCFTCCGIGLGAAFFLGQAVALAIEANQLTCEYAVDPLGVDAVNPLLCWQLTSKSRGALQTAWQVVAATDEELLDAGTPDLWDSGKQSSSQQCHVRYEGEPLQSSEQVFWRVRVWDRSDSPSPWSETGTWTMGVLDEDNWRGAWIVAPWESEALLMRQMIICRPELQRAIVHVCGLGHYELFVNGEKSGDALLAPGWTKYDRTCLYETHDITHLIKQGENAVGLALGDGMHHVERRNRFSKFQGTFGPLRAIAHIELRYADGSRDFFGTDEEWRVSRGPVTYNDVYGGEDYDARKEEQVWHRPEFDASHWEHAVRLVRPSGRLRGQSYSALPIRAMESIQPVGSTSMREAVSVFDLGQNAAYMPRIKVTGPAGSTIRLTHAEVVDDEGRINRDTCGGNRGPAYWQYTKATDEPESWFPQFFYAGCRFLEVEAIPAEPGGDLPSLASLEGVVVHADARPVGQFECSSDLFNRIHSLVRWAQRSNMVSVLTDCPHREKLGWLEQYHLNGPAIRYEFDVSRIFIKSLQDMADSQADDGLVPNIAPEYTKFPGTFRAAAEWGAAAIMVPWQHYLFTGDTTLLSRYYDMMQRYMDYLGARAEGQILVEGLGDWYDLGPASRPGAAQLTPPVYTATAFYYQNAATMSKIAELLDKPEDAERFGKLAADIRVAWQAEFRNNDGTYGTNSQCASGMALAMHLAHLEDRPTVLESLVRDIRQQGNATTAGDVGWGFVLESLTASGRTDVLHDCLTNASKPGYAFILDLGETSMTEAWDANHFSSHNHFMLGQIMEWFYKHLVGIAPDPAAPGFANTIIKPHLVPGIEWAEATYQSIRGPIHVRWEQVATGLALHVSIPANCTATVHVPAEAVEDILEAGELATSRPGTSHLRSAAGRVVLQIEAGEYRFAVGDK